MPSPVAFRVAATLWIAAGAAWAEPIKAGNDLIYPTNPPQKVASSTSPGAMAPGRMFLGQVTAAPTVEPPEFKIEKLDIQPTDKGNTIATLALSHLIDTPVDMPGVTILCNVYDKTKDGTIQVTEGKHSFQWTSVPVDWTKRGTEELNISCTPSPNPDLSYAGMVIGVYYQGRLQDFRSMPETLVKDFPLPESISRPKTDAQSDYPADTFVRSYRHLYLADLALQAKNTERAREFANRAITDLTELRKDRSDWEPVAVQHLLDEAIKKRDSLK